MPTFRFSMQPVLRMREHHERECALALARCEQGRQQAWERLDAERSCETRAILIQRQLAEHASSSDDVRSICLQSAATRSIRQRIAQYERELEEATVQVDRARELLAHAARERMAIEGLRDRRKAVWLKEIEHREMTQLDEAAQSLRVFTSTARTTDRTEDAE